MKNKVKKSLEWYYQRLIENPCKETYRDFKEQDEQLSDVIYEMWKLDLILDKVKDECYEVLQDYSFKTIKYIF